MGRDLLVLAALVACSSGAAVHIRQTQDHGSDAYAPNTCSSTGLDPLEDSQTFCHGFCGQGWNFWTEEGSKEAWVSTGASKVLDQFVRDSTFAPL